MKPLSPFQANLLRLIALALMAVAIYVSYLDFTMTTTESSWIFWTKEITNTISIRPKYFSVILAMLFYFGIVIRFAPSYNFSILGYVLGMANILFFAAFLNSMISNEPMGGILGWVLKILGMAFTKQQFLILGIVMTWLGVKVVAGLIWIIIFIFAASQIALVEQAMDQYAVAYIMCAVFSLIIQARAAGLALPNAVREARKEYIEPVAESVKSDIYATAAEAAIIRERFANAYNESIAPAMETSKDYAKNEFRLHQERLLQNNAKLALENQKLNDELQRQSLPFYKRWFS